MNDRLSHAPPLPTPEQVWQAYDEAEARLSAPLSARMIELSNVGPGMRVLDLATGRGEPAIGAAHRVGPSGSVLGVDLSESMLAMARARASREGLTNLELRVSDAAALDSLPPDHFDAVLARWGLMFMGEPVTALTHARVAMKPGGRLVAAVWAEPERVPYYTLPRRLLEKYQPQPPIDCDVPGTFFYGEPSRLARDLEVAGLEVEHVEEREVSVMEARTGPELVAWARAFGMTRLVRDLPEATQRAWERDLEQAGEALRSDGVVRLGGVTRIVVATRRR